MHSVLAQLAIDPSTRYGTVSDAWQDLLDVRAVTSDAGTPIRHRFWLSCTALALNLLALLNDLMFGPEPPGHLPRRRQAKFVRRMLLWPTIRPPAPPAVAPARIRRRPPTLGSAIIRAKSNG